MTSSTSASQDRGWEACIERAVRHRQRGQVRDAELALGLALEQSRTHPHPSWACARTYLLLALLYADHRQSSDAELCFRLAMQACRQQQGLTIDTRVQFWQDLAESGQSVLDRVTLIEINRELLTLQRHHAGLHHPGTIPTLQRLAMLHWANGQMDDADQSLVQALDCVVNLHGLHHSDAMELWFLRSQLALANGHLESAELYATHALNSIDTNHPGHDRFSSMIRRHLARIASTRGDWTKAHALMLRAALQGDG
jgi:tetratricopeptide (TPR) repeat protein